MQSVILVGREEFVIVVSCSLHCSYMNIVESLPVYGVHFYDVKVSFSARI